VVPNTVALPAPSDPPPDPVLLFVGHYGHLPNRVGAEFFLDRIWPLIRASRPDARVVLAGARPELVRSHGRPAPGVSFPGYVHDLEALYHRAGMVVCPILSGGGTRVKLVEAAAHGRPAVSTTLGAEGLELREETGLVRRDDPEGFAQACLALLADHSLAVRLGRAARQAVQDRYSRADAVAKLAGILRGVIEQARQVP
jgi:glycosyltransferase involved in cell wall biosynthesis